MSSNRPVLSIENLGKCFYMYDRPIDRLKDMVSPKLSLLAGTKNKKFHQEFWALRDVSFEVNAGESVGILGQNGSGKSTLLQIIAGTMAPTTGKVNVEGKIAALLELGSGFNPDFTGRENVYLNGAVLGLTKQEIDEKFDWIASFADIGEHLEQPVKTYSSGMMLRLAFAVQAAVDAQVLIVDEALSVGDARFQLKCFKRLEELKANGTTILFVSHAIELVRSFCDIGIFMNHGEIKYIGKSSTAAVQYLSYLFPKKDKDREKIENNINDSRKEFESISDQYTSEASSDFLLFNNIPEVSPNIWGIGGAKLHHVKIRGLGKKNIFSGGERVKIECQFSWDTNFIQKIISLKGLHEDITLGIAFLDSQGRYIFGCNGFDKNITFIYSEKKQTTACFEFSLPFLAEGAYFITVAIALGTLKDHEQLRWYDALIELRCLKGSRNVFGTFAIDYELGYEIETQEHNPLNNILTAKV